MLSTIYVGAVPPWLTALVMAGQVPYKALRSLPELSTILSASDVSFYSNYLRETPALTGNAFNEFPSLLSIPDNAAWVDAHAMEIADAKSASEVYMAQSEGMDPERIEYTKKAYYEPRSVGSDALIMLGKKAPIYESHINYMDSVMGVLSNMIGVDAAIYARVFDNFLTATAKRARV